MALIDKLTAIADAIRGKTGKTYEMTLDQMASEIMGIETGGGGGGSSAVYSGSFTPAENVLSTTIDVGGSFTHFLLEATKSVTGRSVKATQFFKIANIGYDGCFIGTNNAGSSLAAGQLYNKDNGKFDTSNTASYVEIRENTVFVKGTTSGTVLGYFVAGITYNWYAW